MATYKLVSPQELLVVLKHAKKVRVCDSVEDRVVGFDCDGKLWGFHTSAPSTQMFFAKGQTLKEEGKVCDCCGHLSRSIRLAETPPPVDVTRLKTKAGRSLMEKG